MYICPTCYKGYENEEVLASHFLQCWKAHNPNHESKPAPCKGNMTKREVSEDIKNFFALFNQCQK